MPVYTRPHKRKLTKRSRTLPVYGEGADKGKYFRCWNCGWICNVDRDELGDSDSGSGNDHTDYHEDHYYSTYDTYKGCNNLNAVELLKNVSFELGDPPDDWVAEGLTDLDRHADPNTGTYCLEVNESGSIHPTAYQDLVIEDNRTYEFSFYVKQGTGTLYSSYVRDMDTLVFIVNNAPAIATASYVKYSYLFDAVANCINIRVYLQHRANIADGTNVLFDDVSLKHIPNPRAASRYAVLGGDIGHHHVALNIVTPDGEPKLIRHKYTSNISSGCPFCGSKNYRGDY